MKTNRFLLAYLWDLSRGQRGRILLSCLIGILGTAFALGFVYTSKQLIDIATGARAGSLTVMAAATVGLLALQLLCGAADTWVAARMGVEAANALRHRLFGRLLRSRWNALEQLHTGDVVNRVEQDTTAIVTLLTASLPTAVVTVVQLVAAFAFFYVLDPVLPWLVVGILPLFLLGARFYLRRMKRLTHAVRRSDSLIQSVIQETLQHRTVIKTLEQDEGRIRSLGTLQDDLRSQVLSRTRFSLAARMAVSAAFAGGYVTAFIWGALRLSTGSITVGTLTAFLQLVARIQRPAFDLSRLVPSVVNALTACSSWNACPPKTGATPSASTAHPYWPWRTCALPTPRATRPCSAASATASSPARAPPSWARRAVARLPSCACSWPWPSRRRAASPSPTARRPAPSRPARAATSSTCRRATRCSAAPCATTC